jgi:hypothetical protein
VNSNTAKRYAVRYPRFMNATRCSFLLPREDFKIQTNQLILRNTAMLEGACAPLNVIKICDLQ